MSFMTVSAKDYRMYISINDEKISDASYENDSVRRNIGKRTDGSYMIPVFRERNIKSMGDDYASVIIRRNRQTNKQSS